MAATRQIAERLGTYLADLQTAPTLQPEGDLSALRHGFGEVGETLGECLDTLLDDALPPGYQPASPGYLAYIPGGGIVSAGLATFIAAITNQYTGIWAASPGFVQLELNVVRWFCELVGMDTESSGGFLTTGGSLANFSAVVTARQARLPPNFLSGTLYASDQTHHCVAKAAILAGFPVQNVRSVRTDDEFRIEPDALREQLEADREAGLTPFMLVANAGTTNTGAVDDLAQLADIADRWNLWYHVDAAYGGFFLMTERGRRVMTGIERADSVALDPHKGLFLPYGTGALVVRERSKLTAAHSVHADYLREVQDPEDRRVDFAAISPELSRDARGLRVWLPFKWHGLAVFREALDEKLDLAEQACAALVDIEGVEILARPQLSVVAWRYAPETMAQADISTLNALNEELLRIVNAQGRVMLTGTMLGDVFACRIAVLCVRTHKAQLDVALDDIRAAIAQLEATS